MRAVLAWGVHLYTASAAVFGVWALAAIFDHEYRLAIYLMILTMVIDSTDGALARAADVKGRIPWFDGSKLDDIVDYFTYVIVPACLLVEADLLPHPLWVFAPVLASCYQFSRADAKTEDHFFLGFPSYWNVVAIYLYLLEVPPGVVLAWVLVFSVGAFIPIRYLYPSRTRFMRPLTLAVLTLWFFGFSWIAVGPDPDPFWLRLSLLAPAYYLGFSLFLNVYTPRESEP
jgi:phosphatidylcholine synthase